MTGIVLLVLLTALSCIAATRHHIARLPALCLLAAWIGAAVAFAVFP